MNELTPKQYTAKTLHTHLQRAADVSAISLASLCALHCLLLPVLLLAGPVLGGLALADERFHQSLVFITLPVSVVGLYLGCRKHQQFLSVGMGTVGICIIVLATYTQTILSSDLWSHAYLNDALIEKVLSVLGSLLLIMAHIKNYRLCRLKNCRCASDHTT